jgi:hypothetical protein
MLPLGVYELLCCQEEFKKKNTVVTYSTFQKYYVLKL